jgi:microcystin-dependent protein
MIGKIIQVLCSTVPDGFLPCNGAAVSRTAYAALFDVIGTMYGVGDGATTFNVPDLRGCFLRGWDHSAGIDPDAATRTDRGDGTTGDNVGTRQTSSSGIHTHTPAKVAWHGNYNMVASQRLGNTTNESGEMRPVNTSVEYCIQYE